MDSGKRHISKKPRFPEASTTDDNCSKIRLWWTGLPPNYALYLIVSTIENTTDLYYFPHSFPRRPLVTGIFACYFIRLTGSRARA